MFLGWSQTCLLPSSQQGDLEGEAHQLGEQEGEQLLWFWIYIFLGRVYQRGDIDVFDGVMLAELWRQRGETGFRIVVGVF